MTKTMRVRLKDRQGDVVHPVSAFRDSGDGYRVQAEDGTDLGYFGPEEYDSIIFEIRFGSDPGPPRNGKLSSKAPTPITR